MSKSSTSRFLTGVLTMAVSQLIIKLAGLVYRLVITNVPGFGDVGNGFYTAGFQIYTLLLSLSSVGIPNAISKLVSAQVALGHRAEAHRIFRTALVLFFGIGLVCSAALFFGADFIALYIIKMDGVQGTLQALSPSIMLVCVSSVIRGYFLGLGSVTATSRSQVLEQIVKSVLTIVFVLALTGTSAQVMSAGANFATTVATGASVAYLALYYTRHHPTGVGKPMEPIPSRRSLCRTILSVSIPISLGSIVIAIGRIIDTATITRGIAAAYANGIPGQPGLPTPEALNQEAVRLAGMLSKSDTILNLPLALNIALATVLVPTLSGALAAGRRREAESKAAFSLLLSVLLAFPCAAGLISLAGPIYHLLYPNAPQGASLLAIGAVAMIFMALEQTINGSLQGLGLVFVPAQALLCGIGVKLALNLTLIRLPQVNIYGASFGSLGCYATACTICLVRLLKALPMDLAPKRYFWKPLACAVLMGIAAHWGHAALTHLIGSSRWALLITIPLAAVLYVVFVLASGILTKAEVAQLPLIGRKKRSASP